MPVASAEVGTGEAALTGGLHGFHSTLPAGGGVWAPGRSCGIK